MKRALVGVTAVAAALLVGTPWGNAATDKAPSGQGDPTAVAVTMAVEDLEEFRARPNFGSFELKIPSSTVIVRWKGAPPDDLVAASGRRSDGVTVILEDAPHSWTELQDAADRIIRRATKDRLPLQSVGPLADNSGLRAEVEESSAAAAVRRGTSSAMKSAAGLPVHIDYIPTGEPIERTTRVNDESPWQAGGFLRIVGGGWCSTGFAVADNASGGTRLLSAAHCDPTGNRDQRDGSGDPLSPGDASVDLAPAFDSMLIDPTGSSIAKTFGGPWWAGEGHARHEFNVGSSGGSSVGDSICNSGANTGEHCGLTIYEAGTQFRCGDFWCPGFRARINSDGGPPVVGGAGDSGGPAYTMRSDGSVGARGIYVSGVYGFQVNCPAIRFDPDNDPIDCDTRGNFVGITHLEDRWNVHVMTR